MQNKSKVDIFDTSKRPYQIIVALAWPIFLENVFSTLVHYADTAMVGQLGAYATAAVSISNPAMFLITGAILGLGVGITALVARAVGQNDANMASRLTNQTILLGIYLSIPLCIIFGLMHRLIPAWLGAEADVIEYAAQYNLIVACGRPFAMMNMVLNSVFRGAGDTKTPMRINIWVNLINVIGNFFLIYETRVISIFGWGLLMPGAGWGVSGAAAATALSMTIGGIVSLVIAFRKPAMTQVHMRPGFFRIDWSLMKRINQISMPALFERISNLLASLVLVKAIATLGTMGVAANTLFNTATELTMMPAFAMSAAATTLTGQFLGAKQPHNAEMYVKKICLYSAVVIGLISVGLFFGSNGLMRLFTPDASVIDEAAQCLRIVCFVQPFQMIAFVLAGSLRGAGDTRVTLYVVGICNWILRVGACALMIFVFKVGITAVAFALCIDMVVRALLFALRFRTGKWKTALSD